MNISTDSPTAMVSKVRGYTPPGDMTASFGGARNIPGKLHSKTELMNV
jgi:hypothetical protein